MAVLTRFAAWRWWVLLVLLTTAGCRSGAAQWGPFRGRMVDAETGAPIAGAHVMVSWERDRPNPVHWTQSFYDAQETVTGADGRFEIPRQQRFFTLLVSAPRFSAFAPGYVVESEEVVSAGGRLYADDTVLRMRLLGSVEERCQRRPREPGTPPTSAPRFTEAVQQYNLALTCARQEGVR